MMDILSKYNEADLLLPFLLLCCEKKPTDSSLCQLLFNAYMSKLGKLNLNLKNEKTNKTFKLLRQKEMLEHEIK